MDALHLSSTLIIVTLSAKALYVLMIPSTWFVTGLTALKQSTATSAFSRGYDLILCGKVRLSSTFAVIERSTL